MDLWGDIAHLTLGMRALYMHSLRARYPPRAERPEVSGGGRFEVDAAIRLVTVGWWVVAVAVVAGYPEMSWAGGDRGRG